MSSTRAFLTWHVHEPWAASLRLWYLGHIRNAELRPISTPEGLLTAWLEIQNPRIYKHYPTPMPHFDPIHQEHYNIVTHDKNQCSITHGMHLLTWWGPASNEVEGVFFHRIILQWGMLREVKFIHQGGIQEVDTNRASPYTGSGARFPLCSESSGPLSARRSRILRNQHKHRNGREQGVNL